jgi:hypothetical protein
MNHLYLFLRGQGKASSKLTAKSGMLGSSLSGFFCLNTQIMSLSNSYLNLLVIWGSLAPNCRSLIENPLAGKAGQENDLSITPIDSANSQFGEPLVLLFKRSKQAQMLKKWTAK